MYEIGISGLQAAQAGLSVISNNIANATTEGYHCQEVSFSTTDSGYGVQINDIQSSISMNIECQLLTQQAQNQASTVELENLQYLESVLAELDSGLSTTIDNFINSLSALSSNPTDTVLQSDALSNAEQMVNKINSVDQQIESTRKSLKNQAEDTVDTINQLLDQIANLNNQIATTSSSATNNLEDQRWLAIYELNELAGCTITEGQNGMMDISIGGTTVVIGDTAMPITLDYNADTDGLSLEGSFSHSLDECSGQLGGILTCYNDTIKDYQTQLDTFAQTFAHEFNSIYAQGVNESGSFTQLTGWTMEQTQLSQWEPPLDFDEDLYITVNDADGNSQRYAIDIDPADTLETLTQKVDDVSGIQCTVSSDNHLIIQTNTSENGASFDFTNGALLSVNTSTWTGTGATNSLPPEISISGQYTGQENQTFECSVETNPPGQTLALGTGDMSLNVYSDGVLVNTINIGLGYEPGSEIEVADGIMISLSNSTNGVDYINDGDSLEISALVESNACGILDAVGWNCMFSGQDAGSLSINETFENTAQLSIYSSDLMQGNSQILALIDLYDHPFEELDSMTLQDYSQNIGIQLGIDVAALEAQQESTETIINDLQNQQENVSGVDTSEQTLKMLGYEQMFQAMSKYISTVSDLYQTLFSIA